MSSQPGLKDAYTTPGNPATTNPSESGTATSQSYSNAQSSNAEPPVPSSHHTQAEGTFSSLGRGVRGGGRDSDWKTEEQQGRYNELDAEQMAAPGEGRIRDAVVGDSSEQGRSGEQVDLASDLERKKAEQAPARAQVKEDRAQGVHVGGILGQRGGPASTTD